MPPLAALAAIWSLAFVPQTPAQPSFDNVHAAVTASPDEAARAFQKGLDDGAHKRDLMKVAKEAIHELGRHSASKAFVMTPLLLAYMEGYDATFKFLPSDEVERKRAEFAANGCRFNDLSFGVSISEKVGDVPANFLEDVRAVLIVDGKTYQPIKQPGGVQSTTNLHSYTTSRRINTYRPPTTNNPLGAFLEGFNNGYNAPEITTTHTYATYDGYEMVSFDLFESDGTPRITTQSRSVEFVVICGSKQYHTKFNLSSLAKIAK